MPLLSAFIISLLFGLSFVLPTAMLGSAERPDWYPGWLIFLLGWMGPFMGHFGWFANFLVPVAVVNLAVGAKTSRFTTGLAILLLLLAINSIFWRNIPNDASSGPITNYGVGYYLWMTAVVLSAASLFLLRRAQLKFASEDEDNSVLSPPK